MLAGVYSPLTRRVEQRFEQVTASSPFARRLCIHIALPPAKDWRFPFELPKRGPESSRRVMCVLRGWLLKTPAPCSRKGRMAQELPELREPGWEDPPHHAYSEVVRKGESGLWWLDRMDARIAKGRRTVRTAQGQSSALRVLL